MATLYFLKPDTRSTCLSAGDDLEQDRVQGTPTTWKSGTVSSTPFATVATFDIDVVADGATPGDGQHNIRVSINAIDADTTVRWRLEIVNNTSGCSVQEFSNWFTYTSVGLKSDNHSFGIGGWSGNNILRLTVQLSRDSGAHGNKDVTFDVNHASSRDSAPWDLAPPSQTISMDEAVVTATAKALTVVFGALTIGMSPALATATPKALDSNYAVTMDAASITATPKALTRTLGGVTHSLDVAGITATPKALTRTLGGITPALNPALITAVPKQLTFTIGGGPQTIGMDPAIITAVAKALGSTLGGITPALNPALITATPKAMTRTLGGVVHAVDPALVTATPKALTRTLGGITPALSPALITATPLAMTRVLGGITPSLNAALVTAVPKQLTFILGGGPQTIGMDPALITATPKALSRVLGGLTIGMNPALLTSVPKPLSRTLGGITVGMDASLITAVPLPMTSGEQIIAMDNARMKIKPRLLSYTITHTLLSAAAITATPKQITASFGGVTKYINIASLLAVPKEMHFKEIHLAHAVLTATPKPLIANYHTMGSASLTATPHPLNTKIATVDESVGFGFGSGGGFGSVGFLPDEVGPSHLSGDGTWIAQGRPSGSVAEICFPPTASPSHSTPPWGTQPPGSEFSIWNYLNEEIPNDATDFIRADPPQVRPFVNLDFDGLATFPVLFDRQKIVKLTVKLRVKVDATDIPVVVNIIDQGPGTNLSELLLADPSATWIDIQADFDRDRNGDFWTYQSIRLVTGCQVGGGPSGTISPGGTGRIEISTVHICVVYIDPPGLRKGLYIYDTRGGEKWHRWEGKDVD